MGKIGGRAAEASGFAAVGPAGESRSDDGTGVGHPRVLRNTDKFDNDRPQRVNRFHEFFRMRVMRNQDFRVDPPRRRHRSVPAMGEWRESTHGIEIARDGLSGFSSPIRMNNLGRTCRPRMHAKWMQAIACAERAIDMQGHFPDCCAGFARHHAKRRKPHAWIARTGRSHRRAVAGDPVLRCTSKNRPSRSENVAATCTCRPRGATSKPWAANWKSLRVFLTEPSRSAISRTRPRKRRPETGDEICGSPIALFRIGR